MPLQEVRLGEGMKQKAVKTMDIRILDAADERQYLMEEDYEVYEKQGAPTGAMTFHYHNFYEIIYVLEGEFSSMLEERTFHMRKGDFLLIDQNVMHKYHPVENKHESSKRIILWVTARLLEELSAGQADLTTCFQGHTSCVFHFPIYYEELLQGYMLKLAMTQMPETGDKAVKRVLDRGCLTLFFTYLNVLCARKEYLAAQEELVRHPVVEQVADYIDSHLTEQITVEQLAEQVHMSKYYFLRKFKELTGVTAHTYVTQKRLIAAVGRLQDGMNVTQAWRECGLSDYSSFMRNFRSSFGISPREYIRLYTKELL